PGGVFLKDRLPGGVVGFLPGGKPVVELPAREEPEQGVAGQMRPGHRLLHRFYCRRPEVHPVPASGSLTQTPARAGWVQPITAKSTGEAYGSTLLPFP